MTTEPTVRRLGPDDAAPYVVLRRAMLLDSPLSFLASPGSDLGSDEAVVRERLSHSDQATFGAFDGDDLVGAVGMVRERHEKAAHRVAIWGMYVAPGHRGNGTGRRLLQAAIAHASTMAGITQVTLEVTEVAGAARRLYESVGFRTWGTAPRAVAHGGQVVDEHHMVLFLDARDAPEAPLPGEVVREGVVRVSLPPDDALPLFTARGETLWVPGWTPTYVTPPDGTPVEGGIWLTRDGDTEVIWRVQRYDPVARVAEYLRIVPGNRVVVVRVECLPDGVGTRAVVRYRAVPIGEPGRAWAAAFTPEAFAAMMAEWEALLGAHLAR